MHQRDLFDYTCRRMFDLKQAKSDVLGYDCDESSAQIGSASEEDNIFHLKPRVCPAPTTAFASQTQPIMLPTKRFNQTSPPATTMPSQSPRLHYFISRSNGSFVPLIPADELPYNVRLAGVPRTMKIEHSCGMSQVGTHTFTGQLFQLESVGVAQHVVTHPTTDQIGLDSSKQRSPVPNTEGTMATRSPPRTVQSASQQLLASLTATNWRKIDDAASARSQEIIDNIIAQGSLSPAHRSEKALKISRTCASSPRNSSEQGGKIYCSYWIRSGECDYTQQGCRYKHEMPDKQTLASIGFRTVPRWWQEKIAIQLGQSAIPTVGPVMKPAEWLKQRRSSQDCQSVQESECEHKSDAEDEVEFDNAAAPPGTLQQSAAMVSPTSEEEKKPDTSKSRGTKECPDKNATPALAAAATEAVKAPCALVPDVDLIDLGPISLTGTSSCKSDGQDTLNRTKSIEPCLSQTQVLSVPDAASEQAANLPRKVFVPAGESTEFHVNESRKHAQSQVIEPTSLIEAKQCRSEDSKAVDKRPTTTPVMILKRPGREPGLMASMHAPQYARGGPPGRNSPLSAKKMQPPSANRDLLPDGHTNLKATSSLKHSRAASLTAEDPSPTARKARTSDGKDESPEPARSSHTQIPGGICRPRKPAATKVQAIVPREATGLPEPKSMKQAPQPCHSLKSRRRYKPMQAEL